MGSAGPLHVEANLGAVTRNRDIERCPNLASDNPVRLQEMAALEAFHPCPKPGIVTVQVGRFELMPGAACIIVFGSCR